MLIGQPAEERISGARRMLEDGLYERFPKPDYALAFHVSADGPAGKVTVPQDVVASSSDSVDIVVHGEDVERVVRMPRVLLNLQGRRLGRCGRFG